MLSKALRTQPVACSTITGKKSLSFWPWRTDNSSTSVSKKETITAQKTAEKTSSSSPVSTAPTTNSKTLEGMVRIEKPKSKRKTQAQLDDELRLKLEGISGEGGGAGIEYEGGKAVGLKRGVKDNMFRVI